MWPVFIRQGKTNARQPVVIRQDKANARQPVVIRQGKAIARQPVIKSRTLVAPEVLPSR